jgi:prophage regulatory protein
MTPKILRMPDVSSRIGLSPSTIYAMISRDEFPKPVRLGRRAVGWPSDAIDHWLETRPDTCVARDVRRRIFKPIVWMP